MTNSNKKKLKIFKYKIKICLSFDVRPLLFKQRNKKNQPLDKIPKNNNIKHRNIISLFSL